MTRIERLIWEEAQLDTIKHAKRESFGVRGAKVVWIAALAAAVVLFGNRVPFPHLDEAVVQAVSPTSIFYVPQVVPNPANENDTRRAKARTSSDPADNDD